MEIERDIERIAAAECLFERGIVAGGAGPRLCARGGTGIKHGRSQRRRTLGLVEARFLRRDIDGQRLPAAPPFGEALLFQPDPFVDQLAHGNGRVNKIDPPDRHRAAEEFVTDLKEHGTPPRSQTGNARRGFLAI